MTYGINNNGTITTNTVYTARPTHPAPMGLPRVDTPQFSAASEQYPQEHIQMQGMDSGYQDDYNLNHNHNYDYNSYYDYIYYNLDNNNITQAQANINLKKLYNQYHNDIALGFVIPSAASTRAMHMPMQPSTLTLVDTNSQQPVALNFIPSSLCAGGYSVWAPVNEPADKKRIMAREYFWNLNRGGGHEGGHEPEGNVISRHAPAPAHKQENEADNEREMGCNSEEQAMRLLDEQDLE